MGLKNITQGGVPLKFEADLDLSKFQVKINKALAEIRKLHDVNGGATINSAMAQEVKIREQVIKSIERQRIKQEELNKANAAAKKPAFTAIDTAREVKSANNTGAGVSGTVIEPARIKANAEANEAYALSNQRINEGLRQQIAHTTRLQDLRNQLSSLKKGVSVVDVNDLSTISAYNAKIQQVETDIKRLNVVGRQGFDDLGRAISDKPVGAIDRMRFALGKFKEAAATSTNPDIISKYNAKIQQTEGEIKRLSSVGKVGFDSMGNAIEGFGKKSGNAFQKAIQGLFRMAYLLPGIGVAGLLAFAIDPIINWISGLTAAQKAQEKLKESLGETASLQAKESAETQIYIDKIKNINAPLLKRQELLDDFILKNPAILGALTLQNISTKEGTGILKQYTDELRKKIELQQNEKTLIESIQNEAKIKSGALDKDFKPNVLTQAIFTIGNIATFQSKEETDKEIAAYTEIQKNKAIAVEKGVQEGAKKQIKATTEADAKLKKSEDTSLKALEDRLKTNSERIRNLQEGESSKGLLTEKAALEKQIKEREKLLGISAKSDAKAASTQAKAYQKSLESAQTLQNQINGVLDKYKRNSLTPDEEAITAIDDEFKAIANKVQQFNANPKNKIKIKSDQLEEARGLAVQNKQYELDTVRLEKSLAEQEAKYRAYEETKTALGEDYARERFKKEIDLSKTYLQQLEAEQAKISQESFGGKLAGSQQDRLRVLSELIKKEKSVQEDAYFDQIKALLSYEEQRELIQKTYQATLLELEKNGNQELIPELVRQQKEKLNALDDEHFKTIESYKQLIEGIEDLSSEEGKKVVNNVEFFLKKAISANEISPELANDVIKLLKKSRKDFDNKTAESFDKASKALSDMAQSAGLFNTELGKAIGIAANVAQNISGVFKSIEDSKSAFKSDDIIGGITSIASAASGVIGIFGLIDGVFRAKEEERKQRREEQLKREIELIGSVNKRIQEQIDLNKELLGGERLNANKRSSEEIKKQLDADAALLRGQFKLSGNKVIDETVSGIRRNLFGSKLNDIKESLSLLKLTDAEIDKLDRDGKLNDKAKAYLESIKEGRKLLDDLKKDREKDLTGIDLSEVRSELTALFESGTTSAEDFANSFEKVMKKAVIRSFEVNFLEKQLKPFYDKLVEFSESNGLDTGEIDILKGIYTGVASQAKKDFEALNTGLQFGEDSASNSPDKSNTNSLQGSIKSQLTEETGTVLAGVFRGVQLGVLEGNSISKTNWAVQIGLMNNQLANLVAIERNTGKTAINTEELKRLEKIEIALSSIDRTITANSGAARGNGF